MPQSHQPHFKGSVATCGQWLLCQWLRYKTFLDHRKFYWNSHGLEKSLGEANGTPLQYSCLENSMDGGAWWASVHGVAKSGHEWATSLSLSCIGEGNGNPLQCSCLENLRDGGAWWAAIYGVTQSWTRLKWLSSSSSRKIPYAFSPNRN